MIDGQLRSCRRRAAARPARRHRPVLPHAGRGASRARGRHRPVGHRRATARSASRAQGAGRHHHRADARRRRVRRHAARARSPPARSTSCCRSPRCRERLVELWQQRRADRAAATAGEGRRRRASDAVGAGEPKRRCATIMKLLHQRTGHDFSTTSAPRCCAASSGACRSTALPTLVPPTASYLQDAAGRSRRRCCRTC